MAHARSAIALSAFALLLDCGGGDGHEEPTPPAPSASWTAVDAAVNAAQGQFTGGLAVEVITPAGVVHSVSAGGFSNTNSVLVASSSK